MAQRQPGALERFDLLVERSTAKIPLKLLPVPRDTKGQEIAELFGDWNVYVTSNAGSLFDPGLPAHTFTHRLENGDGEVETVPGEASYYDLKERFQYLAKRAPRGRPLTSDFTWPRWHRMLKAFQWQCSYCGSNDGLEQDHVKPIYQGGQDLLSNIVPSCQACNASKGGKSLLGWLASRGSSFHQGALVRMEAGRARYEAR